MKNHNPFASQPIVQRASQIFRVHPRDLTGPYKFGFILPGRYALYAALRNKGLSYSKVARLMERDHSTIVHGVRLANKRMAESERYTEIVQQLAEIPLENN